ncbi:uncharacterized protein LOC113215177 isoform X1 [Frankliniella occidentalis]|uniref:Uncharacterized protein LOC113215177 isoform X1 n=1 Tax=Frankliniella occidentalis TaxID=133901 RepID=A0A6J1TIA3_FRAOC|nr:uncharacterized protein LOC113215177 isoform X1 [Frankliniella occidentalis]
METLPDDVWLLVLEKLMRSTVDRDIFNCRLVCKRLAVLVLHPSLWRGRTLRGVSSPPVCACPVLRLVPCLEKMLLHLPEEGCRQWSYASTRCAAAKLAINVNKGTSYAAAVICRQEMLGRLKRVVVYFDPDADDGALSEVSVLLGTLASTSRLERLCVVVYAAKKPMPTTPAPFLASTTVASSLRKFRCTLSPLFEPFVRFILSEHAATLEKVDLGESDSSLAFSSTAPLLAGVTNLSKLTCSCLPGLEVLATCKTLRVLELNVHTRSLNRQTVAGVAKLLRRAEHLREVKLEYWPAVRSVADVGADLVSALAASGRSRVETLLIYNYILRPDGVENAPLLQVVARALPSLSALRRLSLEENATNLDDLLLAITPDVAPSLQRVELKLMGKDCAHSWLHCDTVKTVMSVNPSLHLLLHDYVVKRYCTDNEERCQACKLECHEEIMARSRYWHPLCLFSHDPMAACLENHTKRSYEDWIHLPP